MKLHCRPLGIGQFAGLVENGIRHPELPDVMEECRPLELAAFDRIEAHPPAEFHGNGRDPVRVVKGVGRLRVDHHGEGLGDLIDSVLVRRQHPFFRLVGLDEHSRVGALEQTPQRRFMLESLHGTDQRRVEPGSAS